MEFLSNKNGFLGIDNKVKIKEKVIIVPFGLEKTVSYGGGTKNGPKEIIKASHQVELFDEELNKEPYKEIGIKTLKPFPIKNKIEKALDQLSKINEKIILNDKFPMVFGGEHSITPGAIKPIVKKYNEIVLLHFDAHADLRESYNGEKFSHASAIKRCLDFDNVKVISLGIRNLSQQEMTYYRNNRDRVEIFWGKDKKDWKLDRLNDLVKGKNVYITFDVDGFDASIMPATGTPEPGGLMWEDVLPIIKKVCQMSNIVGSDINELAPIKNFDSYNFLVAKLAYKILSYSFEFKS
ncbi:agmatinase [Candidatus Pelagibacter bacterium]|nr:agmatinase [Candidatus Pelagibacter bacterium]MDA9624762.1 agmatinase [Candidatus Pelagibacter bacterium]